MPKHSPLSHAEDHHRLLEFILTRAHRSATLPDFLDQTLSAIASSLGASAAAVVRANPPQWETLGAYGVTPGAIPREAIAEAVDSDQTTDRGEWGVAPLGEGFALCVRRSSDPRGLEDLAPSLALGVHTVQGRVQRERRIRRLETILQITQAWRQTHCMEALLHAMAEAATNLLQSDRASIFLWDRANKQLVGRPALGVEGGELRIGDEVGIVGQVMQSGQPRRVGGGLGEDEIARQVDATTGYQTNTILCVPLTTPGGKRLGAFEVLNKRKGHFTDEDQEALMELAAHASVALEGTQHFEEIVSKHQQLVEQAAEGVRMVGNSPAIEAVRSTTRRIADTDLAILILGENGTGKEVVARSIHYLSRRRDQPFIAVNCAALAETLLESELFGHEKGAFTDARETRQGKFELASGGTLLLDEIGDMSLSGQAKLLRVLEDKTVVRVGGSTPLHTEVRILAATNQDLATMVREKRFREDLFFRLNVVSLELPALRDRGDDVLLLAEHFLRDFCTAMGRKPPKFSPAARKRMLVHRWPGNVRELRNLTERIAYLTTGEVVEVEDLAFVDSGASEAAEQSLMEGALSEATRSFQRQYIQRTIDASRGNMSRAARRLGLHRSNLYRKMRQLGMATGEDDVLTATDGEDAE